MSLRTQAMEQAYADARKSKQLIPLGKEPAVPGTPDFYYWKIVHNRFPHDRHHDGHILIVLKRDCSLDQVSLGELQELWHAVIPWGDKHYDYVKFNLSAMRSVKQTPHLHFLHLKPEYR